jgi:two-component system cell cycle response regulator
MLEIKGMRKGTVLAVDDAPHFRRLYAELLGNAGLHVETVASGSQAMERIRGGGVDLVIADLAINDLGGLEVLRQSRDLPHPPEVILATGNATIEKAIEALKNGARNYLLKPFHPEILLHLVKSSLEHRQLRDENLSLKDKINLFRNGQQLPGLLDMEKLFETALQPLCREVDTNRAMAFLLDEDNPRLMARSELLESEALDLARSLQPLLEDIVEVRLFSGSDLPPGPTLPCDIRSICLLPLPHQDRIAGALALLNRPGSDLPDPLPIDNLAFLLEQTALGFDNASCFENARKLIYTDDLTGLHNYRYLEIILDQEILRAERYGLEFSLVFVDLDYFKDVNDSRGHLAGSQALRETARLLLQSVREADILFRYGGDEFTGFLAETGAGGAAIVAERIRYNIEQHLFFISSDNPAHLTATVGYATFPEDASTKEEIIELADQAMYFGKRSRNVVRGAKELKT